MFACFVLALLAAPSPALRTGFVDLERVVLESAAGRAAREKLLAERERLEAQVRAREETVKTLERKLSRGKDPALERKLERAYHEADSERAAAVRRLERLEREAVDPLVESLVAQIAATARTGTLRLLATDEHLLIAPPAACDASSWFSAETPAPKPLPEICRPRGFVYLDYARLERESALGQAAAKRLEKSQAKLQEELNQRSAALTELERVAQRDPGQHRAFRERRLELADRAQVLQTELAERERAESQKLRDQIVAVLIAALGDPKVWLVEAGGEARLEPACDGTIWALAALAGAPETKTQLTGACSAF